MNIYRSFYLFIVNLATKMTRRKKKDLFKTEIKVTPRFIKSKTDNGRNKFVRIKEDKSGIFGYKSDVTIIDLDEYENQNPNTFSKYPKPINISETPLTRNSNALRASSLMNVTKVSKDLSWRKTKRFLRKNQWKQANKISKL